MSADRRTGPRKPDLWAARLYSAAIILALAGLATNLALLDWLPAIPFAVLLADAPVTRRSKALSYSIGVAAVVIGTVVHSWFVIPVALLFLLSHARADSDIRRAMPTEVVAGNRAPLAEAIRAGFPSDIAGLPRAWGQTLTSRALLDAAITADPDRWAAVRLSEPRMLSAEGGEVAATGWTVVAGEAALVAMNFPNASLPLTIHELAIAAMALPGSNVQRALNDDDRAVVATKVAGLSLVNLTEAMKRASLAPGGELIFRRVEFALNRRKVGQALPNGDWRESSNPRYAAAPQTRASTRIEAASASAAVGDPPEPHHESKPVPALQPSPSTAPADLVHPATARRRRGTIRGDLLEPAMLAWRLPARVLWWVIRPLCTITAVLTCCLAAWHGVSPILATVGALAALIVRPTRHLWISPLLAAILASISPVAATAVAGRAIVTFAAVRVNGPGWRAGLWRLTGSRRGILGVQDIEGAWRSVEEGITMPGELALTESMFELAGATWSTADITEFLRQGRLVARGLLRQHWRFGRVPSAEALLLQMALVESVTSRLLQTLAVALASSLALLVFPVDQLHVLGYDVSRVIAVLIAVVVAWPRAKLRGRTNLTLRRESNATLAITAWLPVVVWVAIVSFCGYLAVGLGAIWMAITSLAIGVCAGFVSTRVTRPALAPHLAVPRLPLVLRWRKGHDIWQAARAAMTAGDAAAAERIWRQLATNPAINWQVSALAKAMLAGLSLDRGAWQEAVEWADLAVSAVPASTPAGYLTRTIAARIMLGAGVPGRSVELIHEVQATGYRRRVWRDPVARMVLARGLAATGEAEDAADVLSRLYAGLRGAVFGPLIESEALVAAMSPPTTEAADRLRSMLAWVDDPHLSDSLADRGRLETAAARAWLALGDMELRLGKPVEAESSLRRALNAFPPSAELMNHATAQVLLGCALSVRGQTDEPLRHIERGLSGLEEARGQLRDSFLRSQLVVRLDDVYTRALDALIALQASVPGVGEVAAVLVESLRRDALASLLRDGKELRLDAETRAIQRDIDELEIRSELTDRQVKARKALRERLSVKMSALYAEAYAPQTVTMADLRRRAVGADILTFKIAQADPDCLQVYSVWIPATGDPLARAITISDAPLLEAVGLRGRQAQELSLTSDQFPGEPDYQLWVDLGAQLLPDQLRASLADRTKDSPLQVFVVPDGILAAFPWAGLRIPDGRHLVEVATIQVIPAMGILPDQSSFLRQTSGAPDHHEILLHCDTQEGQEDLALLSAIGDIRLAQNRPEIETVLSGGDISGAYFATHGHGDGLDQELDLVGGGHISAASALTLSWPNWLIFASCIVGTMRITMGSEPTGLVTSCLLGGAASVIAGVVEVNAYVADRFCVSVAARITRGQHPADALRHTQLAFIESRDSASINRWAGYICVSKIPPSSMLTRGNI